MNVVYIIGKVSNLPRKSVEAKFARAEAMLSEAGFSVINPVEIVPQNTSWVDAMKICIRAITKCTHFYCLPCFKVSPGGLMEYHIARRLELIEVTKSSLKKEKHDKNEAL